MESVKEEKRKEIKEKILEYVEQISNKPGFAKIHAADKGSNEKIGTNQYRELASIAKSADCYKEIELFVRYKQSRGNGWDSKIDNGRQYGDIIVEYMNKIKEDVGEEPFLLEAISMFFGYLYWKCSYITKSEQKEHTQQRGGYQHV